MFCETGLTQVRPQGAHIKDIIPHKIVILWGRRGGNRRNPPHHRGRNCRRGRKCRTRTRTQCLSATTTNRWYEAIACSNGKRQSVQALNKHWQSAMRERQTPFSQKRVQRIGCTTCFHKRRQCVMRLRRLSGWYQASLSGNWQTELR